MLMISNPAPSYRFTFIRLLKLLGNYSLNCTSLCPTTITDVFFLQDAFLPEVTGKIVMLHKLNGKHAEIN